MTLEDFSLSLSLSLSPSLSLKTHTHTHTHAHTQIYDGPLVTVEDLEEEIENLGEMRNVAGKILTELRKAGKWYCFFSGIVSRDNKYIPIPNKQILFICIVCGVD